MPTASLDLPDLPEPSASAMRLSAVAAVTALPWFRVKVRVRVRVRVRVWVGVRVRARVRARVGVTAVASSTVRAAPGAPPGTAEVWWSCLVRVRGGALTFLGPKRMRASRPHLVRVRGVDR